MQPYADKSFVRNASPKPGTKCRGHSRVGLVLSFPTLPFKSRQWRAKESKMQERTPACPKCNRSMVKRRSKFGEFWGCSGFPNDCKQILSLEAGTTTVAAAEPLKEPAWKTTARNRITAIPGAPQEPQHKPIKKVPGSPEQEAIWKAMSEGTTHLVIEAVAGSGKTFSMIQACLRLSKTTKIAFIAFNKHIASEAQGKLQASKCFNVTASTYHSLGLRALKAAYPNTQIADYKTDDIMERVPKPATMEPADWRHVIALTRKLVGFSKNYLLDETSADFESRLEEIADHHTVDLNGVGKSALTYVRGALQESRRLAAQQIDFDDMIWLPVVLGLSMPEKYDLLIVDEAQDTNLCQQRLALLACPQGRIVIVGDRFQAIYGFRGADVTAIPSMTERLRNTARGVEVYPLTVTRRCPKSHVELAQRIVPQIRAMEDAPEGELVTVNESTALSQMRPGDMVLCRCNAPLVNAAYALIRRGTKAVIRGRDLGKGLLDFVEKLERSATSIPTLIQALNLYRYEEMTRLSVLGDKATGRLAALYDRCDCLSELCSTVSSISELKARIESLFADFESDGRPKEAVILGTVHRTKGLEAERVFVLKPELIPHPAARQEWERVQEMNLAYVAATRTKYDAATGIVGTLVFCGMVPDAYCKQEGQDD